MRFNSTFTSVTVENENAHTITELHKDDVLVNVYVNWVQDFLFGRTIEVRVGIECSK